MRQREKNQGNLAALLPIGIFLVLYLGSGILFEYVLHIEMGFYQMPAVVAFLIALFVACMQNRTLNFNQKLKVMANGVADENILTMCLVFLTAGAFSGVISAAGGAESTVNLFLTLLPPRFAVAGLFLISCFVSISMGTSVGTISALAPFAVAMSQATGFDIVLCIAAAASGAMFGDNLSMISDTTIAAVRTQGCEMKDKFRMNFFIALPAAILTFILFIVLTPAGTGTLAVGSYNFWKVLPYLVVLVGAIIGINVFLILIAGSVLGLIVGIATGAFSWTEMFSVMGSGVQAMYDITVISIIVACIGALVREYGGIQWLISFVRAHTKSKKGAQLSIGALVAAVDVATANNTVAIVMTGSLAKDISEDYSIDPRRTASLLDIFASVMQGILPFGAQLLYASAGTGVSAVKIVPYMFYCYLLAASVILFILFAPERKNKR
ncbi:MAG: Na+/H+ antiporter NhaC family protein [Eubacteriales bacterium]|nr:Na+/H+ antiporter NhaC family protein [Eubacteriales bacterium]